MNLTAAQQQEVERAIERLRTSTGTWISDARAAEVIGQLIYERDQLAAWKQSALDVEKTWNVQSIGKLIGLRLGQPIRSEIEPAIRALMEKRQFSREQNEAFETLDREIGACPIAGIGRRYHIELPIETALTLRSLIDNFRP